MKAEHTSNIKEPMPCHRRENILNESVVDGLPNTHPTHMVEIVLLKNKIDTKEKHKSQVHLNGKKNDRKKKRRRGEEIHCVSIGLIRCFVELYTP